MLTMNLRLRYSAVVMVVAAVVVTGCDGKKRTESFAVVKVQSSISKIEPSGPALDVYINGNSINYLANKIEDIRLLFGKEQTEKLFGYGDSGKVFWELDLDGISVIYDHKNGVFRDIVIESREYPIEGGARVGDTKDQILSKYPDGFFEEFDGIAKNDAFYYLRMDAKHESGVGFKFFFDKYDRVRKIDLGVWAFVQ